MPQQHRHYEGKPNAAPGKRSQEILQLPPISSGHLIKRSSFRPSPNSSNSPVKVQFRTRKLQVKSGSSRNKSRDDEPTLTCVTSHLTPPTRPIAHSTSNGIDFVSAALNAGIAVSSEEILFFMWVRDLGLKAAIEKAAKFHLKFQRPSLESRANSNERGKNCSVQNAKRKRPSGSPASSRKRSSGA